MADFKRQSISLPSIYPITDRSLAGMSHTEQVKRLIAGGATFIQLREKHLSPRAFYKDALDAMAVARAADVKVIINDRVDIALAVGADGVHLGQTDLAPSAARKVLGERALIGFSTHSVAQALAALEEGADYLAIGPVFATQTKENPDDVVGIEGVRKVREAVGEIPLVAIGGITQGGISEVLESGADSVALISAILKSPNGIETSYRHLTESLPSVKQF